MKEYKCSLCGKEFDDRVKHWQHTNRKTLCVPKEQVLQELNQQKGKTKQVENKNKILEEKLEMMEKQMEMIQELAKDKQQTINFNNFDFSSNNTNNMNIQTLNQVEIDKYFNVELTQEKEQTLSHISPELFLEILKCDTVDESATQIVRSIYFNPKAPENYTWCVVDKKAKAGVLQFNHDVRSLVPVDTIDTIERNVQNVMPKVLDIMTDIQKVVPLNRTQQKNYHGLYGLYGGSLEPSTINEIKNMAYEDRDLPRSIWKQMCLGVMKEYKQITHSSH